MPTVDRRKSGAYLPVDAIKKPGRLAGFSVMERRPLQGSRSRSLGVSGCGGWHETVRALYRHPVSTANPVRPIPTPPVFGFLDVTCIGRFGDGRVIATDKGIYPRWPVESATEQRQGSAIHHTTRRVDCLKCCCGSEPDRDGDADDLPRKSDSVSVERSRARALPANRKRECMGESVTGLPRGSRVSGTPQARPSRAPHYSSSSTFMPCEGECDGHNYSNTTRSV